MFFFFFSFWIKVNTCTSNVHVQNYFYIFVDALHTYPFIFVANIEHKRVSRFAQRQIIFMEKLNAFSHPKNARNTTTKMYSNRFSHWATYNLHRLLYTNIIIATMCRASKTKWAKTINSEMLFGIFSKWFLGAIYLVFCSSSMGNWIHLHKFFGFENDANGQALRDQTDRTIGSLDKPHCCCQQQKQKLEQQNLYEIVVFRPHKEKVKNQAIAKLVSHSYLVCRHMHALTTNKSINSCISAKRDEDERAPTKHIVRTRSSHLPL